MTVNSLSILAILLLLSLIDGQMSRAGAANGAVTYTYDALGRVLSASYDTGVIVIYAYDANGNRTQQTINVNTAILCWDNTNPPCTSANVTKWDQGLWN